MRVCDLRRAWDTFLFLVSLPGAEVVHPSGKGKGLAQVARELKLYERLQLGSRPFHDLAVYFQPEATLLELNNGFRRVRGHAPAFDGLLNDFGDQEWSLVDQSIRTASFQGKNSIIHHLGGIETYLSCRYSPVVQRMLMAGFLRKDAGNPHLETIRAYGRAAASVCSAEPLAIQCALSVFNPGESEEIGPFSMSQDPDEMDIQLALKVFKGVIQTEGLITGNNPIDRNPALEKSSSCYDSSLVGVLYPTHSQVVAAYRLETTEALQSIVQRLMKAIIEAYDQNQEPLSPEERRELHIVIIRYLKLMAERSPQFIHTIACEDYFSLLALQADRRLFSPEELAMTYLLGKAYLYARWGNEALFDSLCVPVNKCRDEFSLGGSFFVEISPGRCEAEPGLYYRLLWRNPFNPLQTYLIARVGVVIHPRGPAIVQIQGGLLEGVKIRSSPHQPETSLSGLVVRKFGQDFKLFFTRLVISQLNQEFPGQPVLIRKGAYLSALFENHVFYPELGENDEKGGCDLWSGTRGLDIKKILRLLEMRRIELEAFIPQTNDVGEREDLQNELEHVRRIPKIIRAQNRIAKDCGFSPEPQPSSWHTLNC